MDFNLLLKEIKTINKEKGEKCLICHFPITENERHYQLKCNHCYHVDCIKMKNGYIKCPYCLSHNFGKKCRICKKYYFDNKCESSHDEFKCKTILKKGKNKGKMCWKINCKKHDNAPKINKNKDDIEKYICKSVLKSGKRKGQECGRFKCKYHNKINKEINL